MASKFVKAGHGVAKLLTPSRLIYSNPVTTRVRYLLTSYQTLSNNIVRSQFLDLEQPPGNLINIVFENVNQWGSNIAVECPQTGKNYTYNYLQEAVSKWAGFLTKLGLTKGDIIAVCLPNCVEYPFLILGATSVGVAVSTINNNYTAEEVALQLKNSKAKLLVGAVEHEETIRGSISSYEKPLLLVMNGPSTIPSAINLHHIMKDPTVPYADPVELTGDEVAVIPYSSGTTGPPKGVTISHKAVTIGLRMLTHPAIYPIKFASGDEQPKCLCLVPFYHIYGLVVFNFSGINMGVKLFALNGFEPNSYLNLVQKNKVATLHLVPPILNFFATSPLATQENLGHVKHIFIGAAPVSPTAIQMLKKKLHPDVFIQEGYGMTELALISVVPMGSDRIGTTGQLAPNVSAKVIDTATGEDLPPTETGEICIKSPSVMSGYFENEDATASTIDSDGWFHTGDVGFFDEERFLKIVDRTKELIKVNAFQVSPSELEDLIRKHPQVLDVGIVGIPHDRFGEVPKAFIVSKEQISADDIHSFIDAKVAPYKKLVGGVTFLEALPKTATGKLLRRELKTMALTLEQK